MSTHDDAPSRPAWLVPAGVALGLGAGPLLASLLPLSPWTAAAVSVGLLLGAGPVLSGEARVARLDLEQGRSPLRRTAWGLALCAAWLSTLAAGLALLQSAWGAAGLSRLATEGSAALTEKGVTAWMGAQQGFLGQPGLQGSVPLLLALLGTTVVLAWLLAGRRWGLVLAGLLALAVALELACGVRGWLAGGPAVGLLDLHAVRPASTSEFLGQMGVGLVAGLAAAGAGTGALHAVLHRTRSTARFGSRPRALALVVSAIGFMATWPLLGAGPDAPWAAPAPYGRESAALLVGPQAVLGATGWQAAWFAALLLAGLAGALVLCQAGLQRLEASLGLLTRQASIALATLVALAAVPCVILPGSREAVQAMTAVALASFAGTWVVRDAGGGWRVVLACIATGGMVFCAAPVGVLFTPGWREDAVAQNAVLALALGLALVLLWWPALLAVATLRARSLSRSAPASPAGHRTRA